MPIYRALALWLNSRQQPTCCNNHTCMGYLPAYLSHVTARSPNVLGGHARAGQGAHWGGGGVDEGGEDGGVEPVLPPQPEDDELPVLSVL